MLYCMRLHGLVLVVLAAATVASAQTIRSDDIRLTYREAGGASIAFGGVPVFRGSSIQLHAPDWKAGYYSSNSAARKIEVDDSIRTVTIQHLLERDVKFTAVETWRLIDDRSIEVMLSGQLDSDQPVAMEWAIGYVNAFALYGGSYSDPSIDGELVAVHPQPAKPGDDPTVVSDTRIVRLGSRVGQVTVRLETDGPTLSLLDGRLAVQRWWAQETPSFWLGALNVKLTSGEPFEHRAIIEFHPADRPAPADPVKQTLTLTRTDRVYEPPQRPIQVIPTPKRMEINQGCLVLGSQDRFHGHPVVAEFSAAIAREFDIKFRVGRVEPDQHGLRFPRVQFFSDEALEVEAYSIRIDELGMQIRASTLAGFRYAIQTLMQLAQINENGNLQFPKCEIDDEPSLAFRGVHIFPGKDSLEFHRRLIENVIARYKFNHVILECEYTQWASAPEIWVDFSMPREQIRQYVQMLRDNHLEPIPLVQSLGHMGWMFRNDQNLDLAEDPEMPRAYNVTDPKTYAFIDRIYEEALELFGPIKYFHIGHDEITLFGRYPHREESKKWGVTKLFLRDIQHWVNFFKPRKIQIMMWGDMLLAKEEIKDGAAFGDSLEEAKARRDALPTDIIICDWHYDPLKPEDYPSLRIFKEAGFRTIASTWYNPLNIFGFAEAARGEGAWGLLQTTWAGYNLHEGVLDEELKQFSAYILAAEYAWSGKSPPPDELPWRADEVLTRALNPRPVHGKPQAGFVATMKGGLPLANWGAAGADLSVLTQVERVEGFRFDVSEHVHVLAGALLPSQPAEISLVLDGRSSQVAFLHATAFPAAPGEEVGRYVVEYDDGSTETIPLQYGRNIRAWSDPAIARDAMGVFAERNAAGLTVAARVYVWDNPHPDKPIRSVTFSTDHAYASPALFALSGIGEP